MLEQSFPKVGVSSITDDVKTLVIVLREQKDDKGKNLPYRKLPKLLKSNYGHDISHHFVGRILKTLTKGLEEVCIEVECWLYTIFYERERK